MTAPVPAFSSPDEWEASGVRLEVDGEFAVVTLCHPQRRNAQTPAMWRALAGVGRELPAAVRVVLLRAEGVSFSAGLDRAMFSPEGIPGEPGFLALAGSSDQDLDASIAAFQEAFSWWRRPDVITIAAVQGHAVGAGFQLALACDLRICAEDVQFAMRETSLGLVPDLTGTKPLTDLVGYARALEICATGRWVFAKEAAELGLANLVVPAGELEAAARDLAAPLLAAPRNAVIETKALLLGAGARSYQEQVAAERAAQARRLRDLAGIGD
ncbi:enoyl-CoA hydratase/isomerase family protein [Kitasatospora viridis]|uniref:Enoyl-CoA hydratase/carnithine racemase n=1 Tax=Kitasatospora viridis TaxID=281105 RepID=A0A561UD40_9ACTN|nr:enoyl-CoA hydratase/isomerase family protein [Kitasatospora viridis]TWF97269.1 enoyl-CoA hydratase/carnithine racemase [Kitasatospora viridis]